MIRAFVGIAVPEDVTNALEGAQVGLRLGNLVLPENFHVTLAFLGEHPEPVIEDVHDGLSTIRAAAVEIRSTGLGMFGDARPRALFADVARNEDLKALRRKVRQVARDFGISLPAGRFHPHITLARFGRGLDGEDAVAAGAFAARNMRRAEAVFTAETFCLYRSILGRQGPVYEVMAEYDLSTG